MLLLGLALLATSSTIEYQEWIATSAFDIGLPSLSVLVNSTSVTTSTPSRLHRWIQRYYGVSQQGTARRQWPESLSSAVKLPVLLTSLTYVL